MERYIEDLLLTLADKKKKGQIDYTIHFFEEINSNSNKDIEHLQLPQSIVSFYNKVRYLNVNKPRFFEVLPISEVRFLNEKLLWFSNINITKKICFNTEKLNSAGEWDIVCFETNYLITKTLASYISNNLWAWVERERKIWNDEIYE